ncbi:sigma-54-dependent Fis family transcriptional regulator [Desulfopila sp. IMCC35006]|uniref:sigma-54 interaction domain-containing protein n=1 Tax=Desulfopila sp. IMCC35006 TaxID=2569542 RepID=UPI00197A88B5|nr:sigma-54 dependent transcriptional regulator [Desulfopila sp. IMCC35006]
MEALVLLLTEKSECKGDITNILQHAHSLPVLGLFSKQYPIFDQTIIKACSEIESFPCVNQVLDYRLGKIICRDFGCEDIVTNLFRRVNMVGNSPEFQHMLKRLYKIIKCDAPVFIEGETGTGKELAARAIHYFGSRKDQPFIAANCGAIPDQLVENELFGHEKGAYTDATDTREGLISQAESGTLFLDEIETLSYKCQVVLLRFLENMTYRPLGSKVAKHANVRVITATNESITRMVEQGDFRRDLYYRINIMNIQLPPLRKRRSDISLLAEHFIRQFQLQYKQPDRVLHPDSMAALKYHDWPGNVRELENMLHREFLMADGKYVSINELESKKRERRASSVDRRLQNLMTQPMVKAKARVVEDFEQNYLVTTLDRAKGNISEAARLAGKERRSFTRLLEKYVLNNFQKKSY